ncbi:MAG: recombinase family protein [Oscillospiraceae bacterium]|nr:recombinase family protein [Oscillospiraceae bacterium]
MIEIKRVALYARFSSDHQRTESIDAQIRAMKQYCKENRWRIVEIYIDEAHSATTDCRPNFQRMIEDSSKKLFDIVLVHKLDRFSRNRYDSAIYKNKLKYNGVRLCSVLERLDNTPESIIMEAMLESMAEYYSSNLGREVMKGMRENAYQCRHTGGSPPLGYDLDENKYLVINEYEAEAVRIIFDLYINGYSYRYIAEHLNAAGYRTKAGNSFKRTTSFHEILNNEKYTGTYVFNRAESKNYQHKRNSHRKKPDSEIIRIENGCPAIISKDIFLKAKERRQLNHKHAGTFHARNFYLCSGLVRCGECDKPMCGGQRYGKKSFFTYCCHTKKMECCNRKEIDRDKLDAYTIELLEREIFNADAQKKCLRELNRHIDFYNKSLPNQRKKLQRSIDKISSEFQHLQQMSDGSLETYETEYYLEMQCLSLCADLEALQKMEHVRSDEFGDLLTNFYQLNHQDVRFRTFIRNYVRSITVYRENVVFLLDFGFGLFDDVLKTYTVERRQFLTLSQK